MAEKKREEGATTFSYGALSIPNLLTISRILISPLFILLLWETRTWSNISSAVLFALAGLTDFLDGYMARRTGQVTRLGQFLDPLADKIYISTALIMLASLGRTGWWVPGVIIGRELAITALRVYAGKRGISVPASLAAKLKTNSQIIMIVLLMLHMRIDGAYLHEEIAIWLAVALTLYSGLDYLVNMERYLDWERR